MASKARQLANEANLQQAGRRNLIINGAMQVAQRGTSFADIGENTYHLDRFLTSNTATDELAVTVSQSSTAPDGFASSMKFVATTAEASVTSNERFAFRQRIEAQNVQHLKYGTSDAQKVTLSFWVRSNVTGTYGVYIYEHNSARMIGENYTINSADTWEYKTITFVGDTSGGINNDNGVGPEVAWHLMAGSGYSDGTAGTWGAYTGGNEAPGHNADWGETANDEFYITGVQLEVGEVATPFEHRSYGEELALCQRYYQKHFVTKSAGQFHTNVEFVSNFYYPQMMRATPTFISNDFGIGSSYVYSAAAFRGTPATFDQDGISNQYTLLRYRNGTLSGAAGNAGVLYSADFSLDAEL